MRAAAVNLIPAFSDFATSGEQGNADVAPTLVVDVAARRIRHASAPVRVALGLGDCVQSAPVSLPIDAATPALAELAALRLTEHGCAGPVRLTFWTATGTRHWDCTVRLGSGPRGETVHSLTLVEPASRSNVEGPATPLRRCLPRAATAAGCAQSDSSGAHAAEDASDEQGQRARLAHELRTPLSAILSMADVLAEEGFGPLNEPRYRDYARSIRETARHAVGVVAAMLAPLGARGGRTEPTFVELDLNAIAVETAGSLGGLARDAGLDIQFALADSLPRVIADRIGVQQIILNLVSNAIAHAGCGTRMIVRSGVDTSGETWLEVEDDGPGIPLHVQSAIDAGLPAALPCGARHGIGLSLAGALARQNGARLGFAGVVPRGTRARLTFVSSRAVPV